MRRGPLALIAFALTMVAPGSVATAAIADGLPVPGLDAGSQGVVDPAADARYVTVGAGTGTVVARVARDGGRMLRSAYLRGRFTIPAVALDGSAAALSADATTLVLIGQRQRFPQSRTRLVMLDAQRLRVRDRLTFRGDFSFDAISPDGSLIYLVEYLSRRDPTRYGVRAYNVEAGRLLPEPIIDPREPDERMRGFPVTRANSPDGRWAYTLYDGAGKHPFIHALDTVGRTAACIDLDGLAGYERINLLRLAVVAEAGRLLVTDRARTLAAVDTKTFRVTEPRAQGDTDGIGALELVSLATAAVLLGIGVMSLAFRRRRRLAPT